LQKIGLIIYSDDMRFGQTLKKREKTLKIMSIHLRNLGSCLYILNEAGGHWS